MSIIMSAPADQQHGINPPPEKQSKRGPGYTNIEELILCRAFISASENAVHGAHQKGKVFRGHMAEIYAGFIKDQTEKDKNLLRQSSDPTREEYIRKGVGMLYPERTGDSLLYRFKATIAPEVMKYMGIEETTDMASGWNAEDHKVACLEFFKKRYGRSFDFYTCYEYLRDKNKFSSFRTKAEEEAVGKRPIGKKKTKQAEADAKLVKAVLNEVFDSKDKHVVGCSVPAADRRVNSVSSLETSGTNDMIGDIMQSISMVVSNVGNAFLESMKAEQEMRLVQSLDTRDTKAYAKEQMSLMIAETRAKRRRLEMTENKDEKSDDSIDKDNEEDEEF